MKADVFNILAEQSLPSLLDWHPGAGKVQVRCNPALTQLAKSQRVLLLQGPVGPFYDRLTRWLRAGETEVHRVVFQGGDLHDCQLLEPIAYQHTLAEWPEFLAALIDRLKIDCIVMFGQSRSYHVVARQIAKTLSLSVIVLEEGYFRPGYLTMELDGVNGYSTTLQRFRWPPVALVQGSDIALGAVGSIQPDSSPWHFQKMAWHASRHYLAMHQSAKQFVHYMHHRNDEPFTYFVYWLRSWRRKLLHTFIDKRFQTWLFHSGRSYYFVPLQHDGDAQITHHSPFAENTDFIIRVLRSFASHAPTDSLLVLRQHPQSRGGPGHKQLIFSLAAELGVRDRVHFMVEGDTPDLAQYAVGVVLINSTVGLQALERGAPLMALGEALYRQPELTFSGDLDAFWRNARPADKALTAAFLTQMKNLTQVPASLYANRDEVLRWGRL